MVSVIGEFKQGFVTFFRQTKASAKPARSARRATGERSSLPPSRVFGACHSRVASQAEILMGPSRVPVGQETPGTSPWEANSRVTYDDRCSTNERVR